jgi:vacuolar-type H+-ATPase subunit F/Vma7
MKKVIVITPKDAEYGFSIAGATQYVIEEEEIEDLLKRVLEDKDAGVIIIDERLITKIEKESLRDLEKKWFGLLLILPSPEKIDETKDPIMRLLKKTLGYYIKIK